MKEVIKNALGFQVPVFVYESTDEADKVAGRVGAALDEMNNNLYYRGAAAEAREVVAEAVEQLTGVKRKTSPVFKKQVNSETGETTEVPVLRNGEQVHKYDLDEDDYVKLALAESSMTVEQLQQAVTDFIRNRKGDDGNPAPIAVDIRRTERKPPGPKTLAAKWVEAGTKAIAGGKAAKVASDLKKIVGRELAEADFSNANAVGQAIKDIVEEQARQKANAYA